MPCSSRLWAGSRRPRLTPHSGSPSRGGDALDELDAGKDAARILPAAAGASQPFAQDRPSHDDLGFLGVERAGQVARLAGRAHQERDQRGQQVRRDRQARALGDVVDLADDLQPVPGPDDPRQQVGEPGRASLRGQGGISPEATTAALTRPR